VAESTRYVAGRIRAPEIRRRWRREYVDRGLHPLKGFPEPSGFFRGHVAPHGLRRAIDDRGGARDRRGGDRRPQRRCSERSAVLTRVLAITHMDDPVPSLLECQEKASQLRVKFSRAGREGRGLTAQNVLEEIQPYEDLLTSCTSATP